MSTLVPVGDLKVVAIGEVLWDVIGEERHLGGAPFNFCYQSRAFGADAGMITRVGSDDLGEEILQRIADAGMPRALVQLDPEHPTGVVEVTVDKKGVPSYDIREDVAWDFIELPSHAREAIEAADIACFGTLAQRNAISRQSIQEALAAAKPNCLRVYDINLRQAYYSDEVIRESFALTDLLKMNEDELHVLQHMFGLPHDENESVAQLVARFDIATVVVTRGERGATAWSAGEMVTVPGVKVKVKDTVGSGDAFTAVFATQLAAGAALRDALEMANLAGAYVASQNGATPKIDAQILTQFKKAQ